MWFGGTECCGSGFFLLLSFPVVPCFSNTHSFFSCFTSTSKFRAPQLVSPLRSRRLLCPCHAFFPIPFDTAIICANLASLSHDSLQPYIFMPKARTSCLRVCGLLRKRRPISSSVFQLFCPLSSHHLLDSLPSGPLPYPVAICMCIPHGRQI